MMLVLHLILLLGGIQFVLCENCAEVCDVAITWDSPVYFCTLAVTNNSTNPNSTQAFRNSICQNLMGLTLSTCKLETGKVEIIYPGQCGCPNNCFQSFNRGTCLNHTCQCSSGWTGQDCSIVQCPNECSQHGTCSNNLCICDDGWTLNDCSQKTVAFPTIPMSVNASQYIDDKYGDNHPIFNRSTIAQIYLNISEQNLEYLLNPKNKYLRDYVPGTMLFFNNIEQKTMKIGMRIQGHVSRTFTKKSWKISFLDDKWKEIKGFYLKSAAFDPSFAREQLSTVVTYSMGSPVSRSSYATVYINNQMFGLYYVIEDIDKEFLTSRFGNKSGALYKCEGPLEYKGSDPNLYTSYKPETDSANNLTDFINLLYVISESNNFEEEIQDIFDVDLFLRTYVMEVATGNWDGIFDGNNYYLYKNPDTNKFQYFRHDLDLSFGMFEGNAFEGNFSTRNIYNWTMHGGVSPLPPRILSVPAFREMYNTYFKQLLHTYFYPNSLLKDAAFALNDISNIAAQQDLWHHLDYAWSYQEYLNNYQVPIVRENLFPPVIVDSIEEFIQMRFTSAWNQLDSDNKSN